MLFTAVTVLAAASLSLAQNDGPAHRLNPDPTDTNNRVLVGKLFKFSQLPYQIDTTDGERGKQAGYNRCNSTTAGQNSMCQTFIVNDIRDFCLPGPPEMGTVGDTEHAGVAWCTQPTHGARVIPPGTITGAQFIRTPSYIEITGFIKQENINIPTNDEGGEYDSGGQDERGNAIGSAMFSNNLPSSRGTLTMGRVWHAFMGSGEFCLKICDDKAPNASGLCRHTFDLIGCRPAVPAAYRDGVFESCEGEDQDPVTPDNTRIPASSKCVQYTSSLIYPANTNVPAPPAGTPGPGPHGSLSQSQTGSLSAPSAPTGLPPPTKPSQSQAAPSPSKSGTGGNAAGRNTASFGVALAAALVAGALFA